MSVGALLIIKQLSYPIQSYPTGRLRQKGIPFLAFRLYERAGISQVEAYERVLGNLSLRFVKGPTRADRRSLWLQKE